MQQGTPYMPDMTIYVTEDQRAEMKWLAEQLDQQGIDIRDKRGNISFSKMFRYLVSEKVATLRNGVEPPTR
jgi:hypothetical protein